ncbi:phytanoyl-CoA dioxygenase domain-containing protein 1 homolog [Actinia tenebrosa]|uniref:Phytanoyl-CoA dioxygenase domain-containing protein 1 homolog n=1 Tax=Actinia tenebrosa TaxID=6105 RepID=A0A6P8IGR7_ACTTE|nr:phytanoyl-CoA dioxygenase domain-containing protein 1 homolog [Actinia tenebrosa]
MPGKEADAPDAPSKPYVIEWPKYEPLEEWLRTQPTDKWKENFDNDGFLIVHNLINDECVNIYKDLYMKLLSGEINTDPHRQDLGWYNPQKNKNQENICQIMWPSLYIPTLMEGPLHERVSAINKIIVGPDAVFDFDMLIAKGPNTDTSTPWHQDESYWPDMPDKRTATCWVALDNATVDNGCMWFVPGSHKKPLREHRSAAKGAHILQCDCTEEEGVPQPLPPGSCSFHTGRTLHYTRGNTTDNLRRAYITNYRPAAMVEWEREHNFSHGKPGVDTTKRSDNVTIVRRHLSDQNQ